MNTIAFFVCFSAWTLNGVLVTFLVRHGVFAWDTARIGWLIGIPILIGSITRLPIGVLTDQYGGRIVFPVLMFITAVALISLSLVKGTAAFALAGAGLGLAGASFAVGVAETSRRFPQSRQGTALGIFGLGNLGAAFTSLLVPSLLLRLTEGREGLEGWRHLPQIYGGLLIITAIFFILFVVSKDSGQTRRPKIGSYFSSLKNLRVWRFGFYYFCLFGGFVSLAQWLVPYFVNSYGTSLKTAGQLAAVFSLPCGVIRAGGGWVSDHWGARKVLYGVFGIALACALFLTIPGLDLRLFMPVVILLGLSMGIGMGAVYKHIPSYFPEEIGTVGGLVGVIGGLGGFFLPMIFGALLKATGLWSSCWILFALLIAANLAWMHQVVRKISSGEINEFNVTR